MKQPPQKIMGRQLIALKQVEQAISPEVVILETLRLMVTDFFNYSRSVGEPLDYRTLTLTLNLGERELFDTSFFEAEIKAQTKQ